MRTFIEPLESRQLLSATVHAAAPHAVHEHAPATHAPATPKPTPAPAPTAAQTLLFQGQSLKADGSLDANLRLTLVPNPGSGGGYKAQVLVLNADGHASTVVVNFAANGSFVYTNNDGGVRFRAEGKLSADKSSITGTTSWTKGTLTTNGTISLTQVSSFGSGDNGGGGAGGGGTTPPSGPTVPPPNKGATPPASSGDSGKGQGQSQAGASHYVGTAVDNTGSTAKLMLTLTKVPGGFTAQVYVVNPDGSGGSVTFPVDASGHFVYDGPGGKETLHVEGQFSADFKTLAGHFTSVHADGSTSSGSFSLSRT